MENESETDMSDHSMASMMFDDDMDDDDMDTGMEGNESFEMNSEDKFDEEELEDGIGKLKDSKDKLRDIESTIDKINIKKESLYERKDHLDKHKYNEECDICMENSESIIDAKAGVQSDLDLIADDKKEMLQKKVDPLFEKRDEVNQHCRKFGISYKRFTNGQECSSYKGLSKNSNKLKEQGFK